MLRIGWAQDPQTLNPFVGLDEENYNVWAINWDLLVNFSPEDLSPSPGIAESWEVSEDKQDRHLQARSRQKWSDGEPVTSADVKYSLETLGGEGALFTGYTDNVTSIETPDDETVVIKTKRARRPHRRRPLRLHPPRAHLGQGAGRRADRHLPARAPAGRQRSLHRHRVRARAHHPRWSRTPSGGATSPSFDEIQFIKYGNQDAVERALQLGEIDMVPEVAAGDLRAARRASRTSRRCRAPRRRYTAARLQPLLGGELPGRGVQPRGPGPRRPPGDRLRASTASGSTRSPPRTPRSSPTASCRRSTSPSTRCPSEDYPYDPEMANQILDDAGWVDERRRRSARRTARSSRSTSTCARSRRTTSRRRS